MTYPIFNIASGLPASFVHRLSLSPLFLMLTTAPQMSSLYSSKDSPIKHSSWKQDIITLYNSYTLNSMLPFMVHEVLNEGQACHFIVFLWRLIYCYVENMLQWTFHINRFKYWYLQFLARSYQDLSYADFC